MPMLGSKSRIDKLPLVSIPSLHQSVLKTLRAKHIEKDPDAGKDGRAEEEGDNRG